jgi:hypothetical protein
VQVNETTVLAEVLRIAPHLHTAGTFSGTVLQALARHAAAAPVRHSAETGSGASTLLLSHISGNHTVFAVDAGTGSLRAVQASQLLRRESVNFVEGPTQLTLPKHDFRDPLQLVLIDGPHGYPFPDLEYFHLYPHLQAGALLVVDDIHIPTITNLFDFLAADDMFSLQEVVEATAFFRRTTEPTFSPVGDGWWTQGYNRRAFDIEVAQLASGPRPRPIEQQTPFFLDRFGSHAPPSLVVPLRVTGGDDLVVAGWAADVRARRPAAAIDLSIDGTVYRMSVRVPRPDVVNVLGDRAYLRCGFNARLPEGALRRGRHRVELRVVLTGEQESYPAARFEVVAD